MTQINGPQPPYPQPGPVGVLAPPPPSKALTRFLIWTPVVITVLGGVLAAVGIAAAEADGWSGDGVPSVPSAFGLLGYLILGCLAFGSPLLIGSFVWGLVRNGRSRSAARTFRG